MKERLDEEWGGKVDSVAIMEGKDKGEWIIENGPNRRKTGLS